MHYFVGRRSTTTETTAVAAHLGVTTYMFFSHIRTRYFSEGSVQQHPPQYSFRMHHVVRVRVFIRRSSEHHSRNDSSSSSTSWSHAILVFAHIRTRYFSEGSVQQHPPPYSFHKRVLVRPVMKRLFFPRKTKEKKLSSLRSRAS